MSLFDVIKYPISTPPTVEQLSALPKDLFSRWIKTTPWADKKVVTPPIKTQTPQNIEYMCEYYDLNQFVEFDSPRRTHTEIELTLLRKVILEWDDK